MAVETNKALLAPVSFLSMASNVPDNYQMSYDGWRFNSGFAPPAVLAAASVVPSVAGKGI
jgi:hypothetical protein